MTPRAEPFVVRLRLAMGCSPREAVALVRRVARVAAGYTPWESPLHVGAMLGRVAEGEQLAEAFVRARMIVPNGEGFDITPAFAALAVELEPEFEHERRQSAERQARRREREMAEKSGAMRDSVRAERDAVGKTGEIVGSDRDFTVTNAGEERDFSVTSPDPSCARGPGSSSSRGEPSLPEPPSPVLFRPRLAPPDLRTLPPVSPVPSLSPQPREEPGSPGSPQWRTYWRSRRTCPKLRSRT